MSKLIKSELFRIKNSNIFLSSIIIIFIITAIALISTYGIARYKTSLNGSGTASIAKWSFKVKSSGSCYDKYIYLSMTCLTWS